jgi:hypothetical protein
MDDNDDDDSCDHGKIMVADCAMEGQPQRGGVKLQIMIYVLVSASQVPPNMISVG